MLVSQGLSFSDRRGERRDTRQGLGGTKKSPGLSRDKGFCGGGGGGGGGGV